MKSLTILAFVLIAVSTTVSAREYFAVLSPFESPELVKQQAQDLLEWSIGLEPGDEVYFMDGYGLGTLGRFKVPESAVYRSPKARLNANRDAVAGLLRFAESAGLPSGEGQPSVRGAILLPQLLRQVAMVPTNSGNHEVIILASPVYDHPAQPHWSMAGRRFPTDGNIFSSRSDSPYAAADTPELLKGFRVHIAYDEASGDMDRDNYVFLVERYFTLFIEAQSGELVSFTTDPNVALERAKSFAPAIPHKYEVEKEDRSDASIYERPVIQQTLSRDELRNARGVSIGLTWDCASCDLDLYARSDSQAEVLYYDNRNTREGEVRKEFPLSSEGQDNKGFETIYYTAAINLEHSLIGVNFYEGNAADGVNGELRIDIDGKTYARAIHIAASEGNRGVDALMAIEAGSSAAPQTLIIDPLDVIPHD